MSDAPRSQQILDQLVAWLSEIRTANRYWTDAGADVRVEQDNEALNPDPDAPPDIVLLILDEDAVNTGKADNGRELWTQTFTIEGTVYDDGAGRVICRRLQADIARALRRRVTAWPRSAGVKSMRRVSRTIPMRPSASDWLFPETVIEIEYTDAGESS